MHTWSTVDNWLVIECLEDYSQALASTYNTNFSWTRNGTSTHPSRRSSLMMTSRRRSTSEGTWCARWSWGTGKYSEFAPLCSNRLQKMQMRRSIIFLQVHSRLCNRHGRIQSWPRRVAEGKEGDDRGGVLKTFEHPEAYFRQCALENGIYEFWCVSFFQFSWAAGIAESWHSIHSSLF